MPDNREKTSLLVLQSTPFCNIDCKYCYLTTRSIKARMSEDVLAATIVRLAEAGLIGDQIVICWHAGEPLALPITYYSRAIEIIKDCLPKNTHVQFKFQTNGTIIDDDWCTFFNQHRIHIGVSIDGPRDLHNLNRISRSGRGTFDAVIKGVRCLQSNNVPHNVICVLSEKALDCANEIFNFFVEENISDVCFNIEETEGAHISTLMLRRETEARFREFYQTYVRLVRSTKHRHWVREIDSSYRALFISGRNRNLNQQVTPFKIVTVDFEGNLSTFSPELIGTVAKDYDNFEFGNVTKSSIDEMRNSPAFLKVMADIKSGIERCAASCEYFDICGGGAPSNKYFETGRLDSSETMYCRTIIKSTADILIQELLEDTVVCEREVQAYACSAAH